VFAHTATIGLRSGVKTNRGTIREVIMTPKRFIHHIAGGFAKSAKIRRNHQIVRRKKQTQESSHIGEKEHHLSKGPPSSAS